MAPPGLAYLFRLILPQILSVLAVYGALNILNGRKPVFSTYSAWIYLLGAFFARPVYLLVRSWFTNILNSRRALELGAVEPPLVTGSSYDTVSAIVSSFRSGYTGTVPLFRTTAHADFLPVGDCFTEWIKQYGYTFRMNIYGEGRVSPWIFQCWVTH